MRRSGRGIVGAAEALQKRQRRCRSGRGVAGAAEALQKRQRRCRSGRGIVGAAEAVYITVEGVLKWMMRRRNGR